MTFFRFFFRTLTNGDEDLLRGIYLSESSVRYWARVSDRGRWS